MSELFPQSEGALDSPRLKWMKRFGIRVRMSPVSERVNVYEAEGGWDPRRYRAGTEDEALTAWARANGARLWNEEGN